MLNTQSNADLTGNDPGHCLTPAKKVDAKPYDVVNIGGVPIISTTAQGLHEHLLRERHSGASTSLFFANTNFIVKCRPLLSEAFLKSVVIVNDGIGVELAGLLFCGQRFKENLNGTDFIPYLFKNSPRPLRVFMIGGQAAVAARAAEHVRTAFGQTVVGVCNGYEDMQDEGALIAAVNAARPDIVLVAMGNPLQEAWIVKNRDAIGPCLTVGVGALFDFWAAAKPRAPMFIRKMRMEWLFRLYQEPRRLFRRYTIDMVVFLNLCRRYR